MKLKYVDALRGIAILLVMMVHTSQYGLKNSYEAVNLFLSSGARGVQLFFLASAFTLFLSYNHRKTFENKVNRNFYIRRFFRIAPMYFIGIIYFYWQYATDQGGKHTLGEVISNFFFIHGINPYWINSLVPGGWSITVEMTFYLILPLLVNRIRNLNQAVIFVLVSYVFAMIFRLFLQRLSLIEDESLWREFLYYNFLNQLPVFGLGIISYFLIVEKDLKVAPINLLIISLIFVAHFIWNIFLPNFILYSMGFLVLMYSLSRNEYKLFVNKFTMFFGKISYSCYLVHFAVLYWLNKLNIIDFLASDNQIMIVLNYVVRLAVVISISSLISLIFYNSIEVPFQKLGKQFIKRFLVNEHPVENQPVVVKTAGIPDHLQKKSF